MTDRELAHCGSISESLTRIGHELDEYLTFQAPDPMFDPQRWMAHLDKSLPLDGIGLEGVLAEMSEHVIPNGSAIPRPGCTSFITTGATTIGSLATLAGNIAAPQRIGLTAFHFLEQLSLKWLIELFELPSTMQGVYSSGGSVANLVGLGAARQWTFERKGIDPAEDGIPGSAIVYGSAACHHTVHRAAAILGIGRKAVVEIETDKQGRIIPQALEDAINKDVARGLVPMAIVANAGSTSTGSVDPLARIADVARRQQVWFHVDGAYGLPGMLDPRVRGLYEGLEFADSVTVDPHKWLGAPVGIGATFVRDGTLLQRAFAQGASDYLEGSLTQNQAIHSMDQLGTPYYDFGVELSAPSRGAVVWALLREIGVEGLRARVCRHNAMARKVEAMATAHPRLEVVQGATLSICCFRYTRSNVTDLNQLNESIHRQLVHNGINIPSTANVGGKFAIRPCFIGARTGWQQVDDLIDEVVRTGDKLTHFEKT